MIEACDFLQEDLRIGDSEVLCPERADPDDAEIVVAHHHGIGGAPFVAGEETGVQVVDVRLERRVKPCFHDFNLVRTGMLSVVSVCLPGRTCRRTRRDRRGGRAATRGRSAAPFFIALSSSGNRYDSVSRESSVHSMISISSPLIKSINPIASSNQQSALSTCTLWCTSHVARGTCQITRRTSHVIQLGSKFSATPLMQWRSPVGGGPSSNTCPGGRRRLQCTSVRAMKWLRSSVVPIDPSIGAKKLGHPVPLSNFRSATNSGRGRRNETSLALLEAARTGQAVRCRAAEAPGTAPA